MWWSNNFLAKGTQVQGKILIIDAVATNRIMLKIKLLSSFYDVTQATTVAEALAIAQRTPPDLVITTFNLPDANATAVCSGLAALPQTARIPVLAIGDNPDPAIRKTLLSQGVHDVLTRPVQDALLLGRVRSLIRAYNSSEEWNTRGGAGRTFGLAESQSGFVHPGHIQLVGDEKRVNHIWASQLRDMSPNKLTLSTFGDALECLRNSTVPDIFVIGLSGNDKNVATQLSMISSIRSNAVTRHCGILVIQSIADELVGANVLDLGADDLMPHGFEVEELSLRLTSLLRRKRQADLNRRCVDTELREAILDPLTGLYNRRHALAELTRLAENTQNTSKGFAVMIADMDHFKRVNDAFGHASGDAALVETSRRLKSQLRPVDTRIGGEEFLLILPCITDADATRLAKKICSIFSDAPFTLPNGPTSVSLTISIGICIATADTLMARPVNKIAAELINHADRALYSAKSLGRNQVRLIRQAA